jgi:hypothetical protein
MAYTSLPTVNAGDYWTAANHNTYVKNNFDFISTTRSIMLLPNPAVATTNASDAFPRPTFNSAALVLLDSDIVTGYQSMLYATSATNIGVWCFVLPPDFASFEEAQILFNAQDNVGNFDLELIIGVPGGVATNYREAVSSTATVYYKRWDIDITGVEISTDAENCQWACVLARYGDSTDDTSANDLNVYGINLVYKFYTT